MAEWNNRLDSLIVIPWLACDMKCEHCARRSGPDRTEEMDLRVLNAIRYGTPDFVSDLTISGGEPFLYQDRLRNLVDYLPAAAMPYIVTNGLWAKSSARRFEFFSETLPKLSLLSDGGETFCIDLSRDQYHRWQHDGSVMRAWRQLKSEAESGCYNEEFEYPPEPEEEDFEDYDEYMDACTEWEEDRMWDENYVYPDMEGFELTERSEEILNVLPIGRGVNWSGYTGTKNHCHFDGNGARIQNMLTVWPDGRCSACCDGGAWVGNILCQDVPEILRQRRSLLFAFRRNLGVYRNGRSGVPHDACEDCEEFGREFFGHDFKEEVFHVE